MAVVIDEVEGTVESPIAPNTTEEGAGEPRQMKLAELREMRRNSRRLTERESRLRAD